MRMKASPSPANPSAVTRPGGTSTIIALMLLMIGIMIASFAYVSSQEAALRSGRIESRHISIARQALMEADAAVLNAMVDGIAHGERYRAAIARFDTQPVNHFPARITLDGRQTSGIAAVTAVRRSWAAILTRIEAGDLAGARTLHDTQHVQQRTTAVITAMMQQIEQLDARNDHAQGNIDFTIKAVIILQLASGLFCIAVFLFAARRGAVEAEARALAVTNATRSREEVMRLFEMTDMLQSAQDQSDANMVLRATAMELLPDLSGTLYVFSNSRDRLVLSASWNLGDGPAPADTIGLNQCWALKRGKPHVNHPHGDKLRCEHHAEGAFVLEIPMAARGEVLGLFCIQTTRADGDLRLQEIAGLGTALADAMSLALANLSLGAKLRSQALRDPLTGLYNRRYMEDALQRAVQLAQREKHDVSIVMIDLDHFKRLNDQHGHAKGDTVLRDAASVIVHQLRESDVACRYGGEELLVVMPNCSLEDAAHKAERLRIGIAALSQPGIDVSASFGIASIPATSSSVHDLMQAADAALYAAKEQGRNRVVTAPPLIDPIRDQLLAAE
ncbi:GGDEF domain-containing protein [Sphingomonas koreensis]|nr:GGDEF domain-containing protein [Sphingomonas koreensis]